MRCVGWSVGGVEEKEEKEEKIEWKIRRHKRRKRATQEKHTYRTIAGVLMWQKETYIYYIYICMYLYSLQLLIALGNRLYTETRPTTPRSAKSATALARCKQYTPIFIDTCKHKYIQKILYPCVCLCVVLWPALPVYFFATFANTTQLTPWGQTPFRGSISICVVRFVTPSSIRGSAWKANP